MTRTASGEPDRYVSGRAVSEVATDHAEVFRGGSVRVDAFGIPHGSSLRQALGRHGWRPTGHRAPGRGWDVILVEPIRRP